jgi:oxygen-independent coproporphyrinogen-3 oxidase
LVEKYDRRIPRYTSYPTAPHFTKEVDGACYRRWLGEMAEGEPLSLYFHVPFCHSMCWFCGCHTKIVARYEPVADYLVALRHEIGLVAQALGARRQVAHIHWGGGSPNIIAPDDFVRVMEELRAHFTLIDGCEVAVEIDPRTMTEEMAEALAKAGVTRASFGVQDLDPEVQKAINRIQPYEVTERAISRLRERGVMEFNLDLLYGLPHQTVEKVVATVDRTLDLEPNRVALFGYAHVPWMKSHQKMIDENVLPGARERLAQFEAASKRFVERGYVEVGLDHFARADDAMAVALRKGNLHRNFQGYTTDRAGVILGLGASAIGTLPQGYVQNDPAISGYRRTVADGKLATVRGIAVGEEDRLRREVIETLMCRLVIDLDDIGQSYQRPPGHFADEIAALGALEADGIVTVDGARITVTEEGRPLVRAVCAVFDTYLKEGEARHSRAV